MKPSDLAVTHHTIQLSKLRMHYVDAGEGPLVVLLHGFPENWWSWRYQIQPLVDAGFRVIAPDLRGYGDTDKHGPYDIDTISDDVCQLISALGFDKVKIVGHDWGGAVAWHLASKRPEFCERLTVMNCPHPVIMREALINKPSWPQLKKSWYFFFFQIPLLPEWLLTRRDAEGTVRTIKGSSIDRSHFSLEEMRPFRDGIQKPGAASAMIGWYRHIVRDGLSNPFNPPAYEPITVDTLLIWGMKDPALGYAELVPGTEKHVPKLKLVQIPECGHFVQAERPDAVNPALISFLRA
ncbi:MAG: alpha/beta fold hydrolase [Archangium sp.]